MPFFLWLYVCLRLVWPLPLARAARLALVVLLLLAAHYHLLLWRVFASPFAPEMPRPLMILGSEAFACFVWLAALTLAMDVALLAARLLLRQRPSLRLRTGARGLVAAAALALSAFSMVQALAVPEVRRVDVALRNLPAALEGATLVQLTDLHLSPMLNAHWAQQVVAKVNALSPDLVVITGDVIDGTPAQRAEEIRPLADLRARWGVVTILGNHEYYFGAQVWAETFRAQGMRVLLNEHVVLGAPDAPLVVAGLTDEAARRFDLPLPDATQALTGTPPGAPVILLAHQPKQAKTYAALGADLQLSGHTHGGMVRGLDRLVARANAGFVSGGYALDEMLLYVSNGTGLWNGFSQRLGVPAEITLFTLHRAADGRNAFLAHSPP